MLQILWTITAYFANIEKYDDSCHAFDSSVLFDIVKNFVYFVVEYNNLVFPPEILAGDIFKSAGVDYRAQPWL